jgi:hypothetical protein
MTTVINLNIVNFFRLKLNKFTVDDISSNTRVPDKRYNYSPGEKHVIDVTPYSRVIDDYEVAEGKDTKFPVSSLRKTNFVMSPPEINKTYDRRGKTIQYFQPKGVYVDSYV